MISALIFFPTATCDQENQKDILINKVLLRGKSDRNMKNNGIYKFTVQ